jgi:type VII secretion protein EccB
MRSRRDQVSAQHNLASRLTSALVRAEPDLLEPPTRRDIRGLAFGVVAMLLLLAGVAVWALMSGQGSTAWREPGTLIIDNGSGSRFLLVDGVLRPVRNIASARLLTGGAVRPVVVPSSRLAGVPRGAPLGILNGPDTLPESGHLNEGVWRLCTGAVPGGGPAAGTGTAAGPGPGAHLVLDIGGAPSPERIGDATGLLVSAGGREYLLWRGQRLRMARPWAADVLGLGAATPTAVPDTWLKLVPSGPDLAPVSVPGRGGRGRDVGGRPTRLGQLFAVATGAGSVAHYIGLTSGLAPLTATQYALTRAEAAAAPELTITPADLAAAPRADLPAPWNAMPAVAPAIRAASPRESICLETLPDPGSSALDVVLSAETPSPDLHGFGDTVIRVRPGGGALLMPQLRPADSRSANEQPGVLVDGSGTRYPATGDAIKALGYEPAQAVVGPWQLRSFLPSGPPLTTPGRR